MRGIKSHKKRLLKKYKRPHKVIILLWPSKVINTFAVIGPYEHRYVKNVIRRVRSSHMLKEEYKRSPDTYRDVIAYGVNILMNVMLQVIESGCAVTPTKYNKRIRAKSKIKKEAQ